MIHDFMYIYIYISASSSSLCLLGCSLGRNTCRPVIHVVSRQTLGIQTCLPPTSIRRLSITALQRYCCIYIRYIYITEYYRSRSLSSLSPPLLLCRVLVTHETVLYDSIVFYPLAPSPCVPNKDQCLTKVGRAALRLRAHRRSHAETKLLVVFHSSTTYCSTPRTGF